MEKKENDERISRTLSFVLLYKEVDLGPINLCFSLISLKTDTYSTHVYPYMCVYVHIHRRVLHCIPQRQAEAERPTGKSSFPFTEVTGRHIQREIHPVFL